MTWDVDDPEYVDWLNSLVENAPEHYDGEEAQEHLVLGYIRDLEAVRDSAVTVVERLACGHGDDAIVGGFDPECGRCEWMLPFRSAMAQALGDYPDWWPADEDPAITPRSLDWRCAGCGKPLGREWRERYNPTTDGLDKVHLACGQDKGESD